jgi:general secretion pathway protein J
MSAHRPRPVTSRSAVVVGCLAKRPLSPCRAPSPAAQGKEQRAFPRHSLGEEDSRSFPCAAGEGAEGGRGRSCKIVCAHGFTLIELLVALVVFAALAAAAYGGLDQIARTRAALAAQQDRFAAIARTVSMLERDLRQAVDRSVTGNNGSTLPALIGNPDTIELSRLGFANPLAEPRSNIERVVYALDSGTLQRGRYAVLDRAPDSAPATRMLVDHVGEFHLRYFDRVSNAWSDVWPLQGVGAMTASLPRAVEFRIVFADLDEIRRVVELPSSLPPTAAEAPTPSGSQPIPSPGSPPTPSGEGIQ